MIRQLTTVTSSPVAVVIPAYNVQSYVASAIESVRSQSHSDWRVVVVDDGSEDCTRKIVLEVAHNDSRVQLICQSNAGVSSARQRGFEALAGFGDFVIFLDADDRLKPDMMSECIAYLHSHPEVGLVVCNAELINGDGDRIGHRPSVRWRLWGPIAKRIPEWDPEVPIESILAGAAITPSVCTFRRTIFERTHGWDMTIGIGGGCREDMDLALQMKLLADVHHFERTLVEYRVHGKNQSLEPGRMKRHDQLLENKWRLLSGTGHHGAKRIVRYFDRDADRIAAAAGFCEAGKFLRLCRFRDAIRYAGGALKRQLHLSAVKHNQ